MFAGRRLLRALHASVEEVDNTFVSVSLPKRTGQECPTEWLTGNTVPIHQKKKWKTRGEYLAFLWGMQWSPPWCESTSQPHTGTRLLRSLPVSLPRVLRPRGNVSLDAGQLINCRKINVLETVPLLRGACCLIKRSTLSRIAYLHDPAGRLLCWLLFLAWF